MANIVWARLFQQSIRFIIMSALKGIFFCCGGMPNDAEIVFNMQERQRSFSCRTSDKRIFIKRSVGKNPILDLSVKNTNRSTENTPKARSNMKINRIRDPNDSSIIHSPFDISIQTVENGIGNTNLDNSNGAYPRQSGSNRQKMQRFINFDQYNQRQFQNLLLPCSNQQIVQLYQPQQLRPTNMYERRIANHKQDHSTKNGFDFQNRQLIKTMKTIVEAIDERSSIPSMSESQMNQMRQISSKATIKSHIYDRNQAKNSQSPFTQKYESMVIRQNSSKQSLRMANSENLPNINHQLNDQYVRMALNKLQMENSIALKELHALEEQENFLRHQKDFDHSRFEEQIRNIDKMRGQYMKKLSNCQGQLNQIKEIIKFKQQNNHISAHS